MGRRKEKKPLPRKGTGEAHVFISYSHESGPNVQELAKRLRANDVRVLTDRDSPGEPTSDTWHRWMDRKLTDARHVLMICTPKYREKWDAPGLYTGVAFEREVILDLVRQPERTLSKLFIPCIL